MWMILKDRRMAFIVIANLLSSVGSGITMIGVPWLLVNRPNGDEIYGYATLATTITMFLISPQIGVFIDRFSRKKLLLASEIAGGGITILMAFWGLIAGHYDAWQLIAIYAGASLYYNVHFPAQFAFTQEIFPKDQYKALNSVLEIQNQSASMIAGGLSSLLIDHVDFFWILLVDAGTYLAGFGLFLMIPYARSRQVPQNASGSMWSNIAEGFRYLKQKPELTVFFFCALIPFLCVMAGNYLYPVYISTVLRGGANVLGASEMIYAIGAVLAGLTVPLLVRKLGSYGSALVTFIAFAVSVLFIYAMPLIGIYLSAKIINGWGNAGTRVARNIVMMESVPNHLIGRVNSFFNAMGMGVRVLLIGASTQIVTHFGARSAVLLLIGFLLFGFFGLILSNNPMKTFNVVMNRVNRLEK